MHTLYGKSVAFLMCNQAVHVLTIVLCSFSEIHKNKIFEIKMALLNKYHALYETLSVTELRSMH